LLTVLEVWSDVLYIILKSSLFISLKRRLTIPSTDCYSFSYTINMIYVNFMSVQRRDFNPEPFSISVFGICNPGIPADGITDWQLYKRTSYAETRGQCNLTKSASRGAHSLVRGHPRGSKVVPLNSWGRVSY